MTTELEDISILDTQPVSTQIIRQIKKASKADFEHTYKETAKALKAFPGYLGSHIFYPPGKGTEYRIIFTFDNQAHLDAWNSSDERAYWVERMDAYNTSPPQKHIISGLEAWFALPMQKHFTPPPRYKMALVSWCAITPLLYLFKRFIAPSLATLPEIMQLSIASGVLVCIMTFIAMPSLTKLLRSWLFKTTNS